MIKKFFDYRHGLREKYTRKYLAKRLNANWLNADRVRRKFNDWDEGILRQSKRMKKLSNFCKKNVVIDLICPFEKRNKNN